MLKLALGIHSNLSNIITQYYLKHRKPIFHQQILK